MRAPSSITTSCLGVTDGLITTTGMSTVPPVIPISADPPTVDDTFLKSLVIGALTLARIEVGISGVVKATTVATYAKKRFRSIFIEVRRNAKRPLVSVYRPGQSVSNAYEVRVSLKM